MNAMSIPGADTLSVRAQTPLPAECHDQLVSALQAHGFSLIQEETNSNSAVLLALEQPDQGDFAATTRLSRNGQRRLIVAFMKPATVNPQFTLRLLAHGASEVLSWSDILADPASLCARLRRWHMIDSIASSSLVRDNLVGLSQAWTLLLRRVVEAAHFTGGSVLLIGDSGTGKKLLARLIHTLDSRTTKHELVVLDCDMPMPGGAGSAFFGHRQGSLTCARNARDGAFELAHQGTLFLDNVDKLPMAMQAELLQVLDERGFRRLGSNCLQKTEFRLICASRRDLWSAVNNETFRRDLYYRLAGWVFRVPALAERREDILPLARHIWTQLRPDLPEAEFAPCAAAWLQARDYPGNIPDLHQVLSRMATRHVGHGPIGLADIPEDGRADGSPVRPPWGDPQFRHAIERAVMLGFTPKDIGRAASELAWQMASGPNSTLQDAGRREGTFEDESELPETRADPAYPVSIDSIEPVARTTRKLVLRPAQAASHTEPIPSDASHLPRPIPRNSDEEQPL